MQTPPVIFTYKPLTKFFILLCIGLISIGIFISMTSVFKYLLILPIGLVYSIFAEIMHDTLHGVFVKSKKLNYIFGFILGCFNIISFTYYQKTHLYHHKYLGTQYDFDVTGLNKGYKKFEIWMNIFGLDRFFSSYYHKEFIDRKIILEYSFMLIIYVTFIIIQPYLFFVFFVMPFIFIKSPLSFIIQLPEHYGIEKGKDKYELTWEGNKNTFFSWLTNGNNFHCTHHIYPQYQSGELGDIHDKIQHKIKYRYTNCFAFFFKNYKILFK